MQMFEQAVLHHRQQIKMAEHTTVNERKQECFAYSDLGNALSKVRVHHVVPVRAHSPPPPTHPPTHPKALARDCELSSSFAFHYDVTLCWHSTQLGRFEEAVSSHNRALLIATELGDRAVDARCCAFLGDTFRRRGEEVLAALALGGMPLAVPIA
jgi:hypothetical protein